MSETTLLTAEPTPLASFFPASAMREFAGTLTPDCLLNASEELLALHTAAGVYDLGWRARLRITGEDRVRWLNGMVTNTVKALATGHLNYTFLLSAQGRIQGDGEIYALPNALLFATDRAQAPKIQQHLDHFIIMDDVELAMESGITAIGIAGPQSLNVLTNLGLADASLKPGQFKEQNSILIAHEQPQQYVLWMPAADVLASWERLIAAGAVPCGIDAVESLRVLSGLPRYGMDIQEKSLAQETGQVRALNFNKGCYLGQEIVERIRSRATIHRSLRTFRLEGDIPSPGTSLFTPGKPDSAVGELSSIATVTLPHLKGTYALGIVRTEAAEAPLAYSGGQATALPRAPLQTI